MVSLGWQGGIGVQWTTPIRGEPYVTITDGYACGFILFGSDEVPDKFTALTRQSLTYRYAEVCSGGWLVSTTAYEQYTYASRLTPFPLPLVYTASDRLTFSLRGLWTKEDEWTLSGDPRAPNQNYAGTLVQVPTTDTRNFMTIQTYF